MSTTGAHPAWPLRVSGSSDASRPTASASLSASETGPSRSWASFPIASGYPAAGTEIWMPLPCSRDGRPLVGSVSVAVRLRSPDCLEQARSQLAVLTARLTAGERSGRPRKLSLITLEQDVNTRSGFGLVGLLGPSVVVLLIACGNVANLLLARAARREREMAVRAALGASRWRLIRERLAENAWPAAAGGALGIALAFGVVAALRTWLGGVPESHEAAQAIRLDERALLFALAVTAVIPFVFGLVPAFVASRPSLQSALHASPGRRKPRRGPYGGRDVLVIVEVGLAVVLVIWAGAFARFLTEMWRVQWGFDATKVVAAELSSGRDAARPGVPAGLSDDVLRAVRGVPGVDRAALGSFVGLDPVLERRADRVRGVRDRLERARRHAAAGGCGLLRDAGHRGAARARHRCRRHLGLATRGRHQPAARRSVLARRGSVGPPIEKRPDVERGVDHRRWRGARRHDDQGRRDGRSGLRAGHSGRQPAADGVRPGERRRDGHHRSGPVRHPARGQEPAARHHRAPRRAVALRAFGWAGHGRHPWRLWPLRAVPGRPGRLQRGQLHGCRADAGVRHTHGTRRVPLGCSPDGPRPGGRHRRGGRWHVDLGALAITRATSASRELRPWRRPIPFSGRPSSACWPS